MLSSPYKIALVFCLNFTCSLRDRLLVVPFLWRSVTTEGLKCYHVALLMCIVSVENWSGLGVSAVINGHGFCLYGPIVGGKLKSKLKENRSSDWTLFWYTDLQLYALFKPNGRKRIFVAHWTIASTALLKSRCLCTATMIFAWYAIPRRHSLVIIGLSLRHINV